MQTLTVNILGKNICGHCKHFYQHYIFSGDSGRYVPVHVGHCAFPRLKDRRADDTCQYYVEKSNISEIWAIRQKQEHWKENSDECFY